MRSLHKKRRRWLLALIPGILLLLLLIDLLLQDCWAHRRPYFSPDYAQADLSPILARESLSEEDYEVLFQQTGLGKSAVDALLTQGDGGRIPDYQAGFFAPVSPKCITLLGGRFTCEDRLRDEEDKAVAAVPLAPLEPGDILVTLSTHTFGWRHGHAGLVVDAQRSITLEAAVMGSDSVQVYADHWRTYSGFMVLRVKGATEEQRLQVVQSALTYLDGIPYSLLAGLFGPKAPAPSHELSVQCSYLPWYAWRQAGIDLDGDGGRVVTPMDLIQSPLVEVVQVYGFDPRALPGRGA